MFPFLLAPVLALMGCAAGFALRLWQLTTAFEPDTGLLIPGAPATAALTALSLALPVLLALLLWRLCRKAPTLGYADAFRREGSAASAVNALCAALMALGGLSFLLDYVSGSLTSLLSCVLAALLVGSGASLLFRKEERFSGYLLLPAYAYCLWLVLTYQAQAGNPVIQAYVYQILAVICSLLTFYFTAGFSFEKGKPFPTLCAGLLAVFFSGIALADFDSRMNSFLFSFSIVYFTAHSAVLLRNLTAKREE